MKRLTVVLLGFLFLFSEANANIRSDKKSPWKEFSHVTCSSLTLTRSKRYVGNLVQNKLEHELDGHMILSVISKPGVEITESPLLVEIYTVHKVHTLRNLTHAQYLDVMIQLIKIYDDRLQRKLADCGAGY